MKVESFTEFKTGRLEPITVLNGTDYAFIPKPLPPDWKMREDLWPLLVSAHRAVAKLDGIGRTLPSPFLLLRPMQRREAIRSSSLEGTFATPEQMLLFEAQRKQKPRTQQENDWREVFNYDRALRRGSRILQHEVRIDRRLIADFHKILMKDVRGRDKDPGVFRLNQVYIGSSRRFIPPPAPQMLECLNQLEQFMVEADDQIDPLVRAFIVHYQFEAIHPFMDGNGRVGRLLLSLSIASWMDLSQPWLYMSEYYEKFRDEYLARLFAVSTNGEWDEWIEFCLRGTIQQATESTARIEQLQALRVKYQSDFGHTGKNMHDIIERLFDSPLVRIPELAKHCKISYTTAKTYLEKLVIGGVLEEVLDSSVRTFFATEVFDTAYGETE